MTDRPRHALAAIKSVRTEDIRDKYERYYRTLNERFLDCWFNETTRNLLAKAAEKF